MENLDKKLIITIGREFGSGGRDIGKLVANRLGINCYDNELITQVAKNSGFCEEILKDHDEKPTNSFLYSLVMDTHQNYNAVLGQIGMPLGQQLFLAQFNTIKDIAAKESCVFIGRCADYALNEDFNVLSIFINSNEESKIKRITKRHNVSEQKAREMMIKTDKKRASYYNYYTDKKWGNSSSYDLCINSGKLGIEKTVELILSYVDIEHR